MGRNAAVTLIEPRPDRRAKAAGLGVSSVLDPDAGDLAAQAERTYGSILELLAHVGGTAEDLIETIEYVPPEGVPDYRAVAEVRGRLLRPPWPASVGAVCGGLLRPEFMLEVLPMAVLGS